MKLRKLIAEVGNPSVERLADAIEQHTGTSISGAYLWQLGKGKRDNPTLQHLTALSAYFSHVLQVPVTMAYFDPATPVDQPWVDATATQRIEELQQLLEAEQDFNKRMKDHGIRRVAMRLGSMDPQQLRQLLAIADVIADPDSADKPSEEK